jgi:hypothetical protein
MVVIAAVPLAFLVVTDGRAFGVTAGRQDRTVEVESQASQAEDGQTLEEQFPQ